MVQGCTPPILASRTVQSKQMTANTSWSNSVLLEMALNWTTDTQTPYGTAIELQLSVVSP
jgi:hypothetical protein